MIEVNNIKSSKKIKKSPKINRKKKDTFQISHFFSFMAGGTETQYK